MRRVYAPARDGDSDTRVSFWPMRRQSGDTVTPRRASPQHARLSLARGGFHRHRFAVVPSPQAFSQGFDGKDAMTSKIRIIGTFGEEVLDEVTALADKIGNVQYVSLLVDGQEKATDTAPPTGTLPMPEETVEAGTTAAPAPAAPAAPAATDTSEQPAEGAEQGQPEGAPAS